MRAHVGGLVVLTALLGGVLSGCGEDSGDTATDPSATAAAPTSDSAQTDSPSKVPSEKPVSVRKTCGELYHPPIQPMPRAIEFVHGSPSADEVADAEEIDSALSDVAGHSEPVLAEQIEVVRVSVDAQMASVESGSGDGPDLKEFDASANRLAGYCELYND